MTTKTLDWPDEAVVMLRRLWQEEDTPLTIGRKLTVSDPTGRRYTRSAVTSKAIRINLPTRRFGLKLYGKDGEPIIRLVFNGLTNAQIGTELGLAKHVVAYRVATLISYGLLNKRKPGPRKRSAG
jgi:hypothetical protein